MTANVAKYEVLDLYPHVESPVFPEFSHAIAGCWIRKDMCGSKRQTDQLVASKLQVVGWEVAATLLEELVDDETYRNKADGREYFEQSMTDGLVFHLHQRRREILGSEAEAGEILQRYRDVIAQLRKQGAYTFSIGNRWAAAVTEDGDEFLPMWLRTPSERWTRKWASYRLTRLSRRRLLSVLAYMRKHRMYCGLGTSDAVVMFHPVALAKDLTQKP